MSESSVLSQNEVNYRAGREILLNAGFEVELGSELTADIEDCPEASIAMLDSKSDEEFVKITKRPEESIQVFDIEGSDIQTIRIYLPEATKVKISILDSTDTLVTPSSSFHYKDHRDHYKRVNTHKLTSGVYTIRMDSPSGSYRDKMTVL